MSDGDDLRAHRGEARARVGAFVDAVRTLRDDGVLDRAIDAIARESSLHPSNVAHALRTLLEVDATSDELDAMVARAPSRAAVAVVLSSNVFLAPFRAVAWALAQSSKVVVRPSRRARAFVDAIAPALTSSSVEIAESNDDSAMAMMMLIAKLPERGALHLYGGTAAVEAARMLLARSRKSIAAELHGPGFGAIVATADAIVAHADAIALDVVAFDQRGCLSPRTALVIGAHADVPRAAEAVHRALEALSTTLPRAPLDERTQAEVHFARDASRFTGRPLEGKDHLVLDLARVDSLALGPAARVLPFIAMWKVEDAIARLQAQADGLSTIATEAKFERALAVAFPKRRMAALGGMQRPAFDGPVDLRVFL